jgi:roadblock/LC7 domain-containing protein
MMWLQTDSANTMAEYNAEVDLARISADSVNQQALYGSFVSSNQITGDVATAGMTAMGNVDYTPFVNGMVSLGEAGLNSNVSIATVGLNTAGELGVTGMNNLTNLGAAGMTAIQTVGTEGFDALNASTAAWLNYSATRDTTFAGMMATEQSGCVVTANAEGQIVVTCP